MRFRIPILLVCLNALLGAVALGFALPARAQAAKERSGDLDDLKFARPELRIAPQHQDLNQVRTEAATATVGAFDAFLHNEGMGWRAMVDRVTGRPALIEGQGIPWIPGKGNHLKLADLGLKGAIDKPIPVKVVAAQAAAFLAKYPDLLGVDPHDLALMPDASGPMSDYLYFLNFQWLYHGIPVEHANVVFRLNHGNLVQFGQENISASISALDPAPSISRETAWDILHGYLGGSDPSDEVVEKGRLLVVPFMTPAAASGAEVAVGTGLEYRLIYALAFRRPGVLGTWEGRVDAHTGEVVSFLDTNEYGSVHGGVYTNDKPTPEVDRPLPFADIGGGLYANGGGFFSGTSATSALNGKYVKISDVCGSISDSTSTGDLNFGSSAGTDCTTPGSGGAGNTHAARTQYYNVNMIRLKALSYMPANGWLNSQVTDNVNINSQCNAYWNGSSLNFFHQGGNCGNTGEIMGVSMHEWGHGMDSNDGNGSSPENGTGETYGDWTATLQTHNSCVGAGFYLSGVCGGYGNPCLSCTSLRDLDYAQHSSPTPDTPPQLAGSSGFHCGLDPSYPGPCGYEGHCESGISSQALWDLANRDLVTWGLDQTTAWELVDKLWYRSRSTATAAYACPTVNTTDGCGAGSLFTVFRAMDDDDGNLANGTPHASAIYAAFNRHAIACNSVVNTDSSSCAAIGSPAVSTVLGTNQVTVNWTAASGAVTYDVYRNELGCGAGYARVGTVSAPTQTFSDGTTVGGITYYYRVQAVGSSAACAGAMSGCSTIGGPLSATASGLPTTGIIPFTVNFTGAGINGTPPYSYAWDFGDGNTGSGATPSHSYTTLGVHTVKLTVTDSATPAVVFSPPTFTITACGNNTATPASLATETAGTYYSTTFTGGGGVGPYTFFLSGALPTGVSFLTDTLSGTPMQLGTFPLTLTVTDSNGCFTNLPYSLTVICPVVTISPTTVPPAILNAKYCQQLTASGCVGSCTFSLLSGAFPPGITMDSTGYISGKTTAHGTATFTIRATTILGCHGDQAYTMKLFDLVLLDDTGRSRFYGDRTTGAYEWDILTGPGTGSYSGVAYVENGGAKFVSKPGDLNTLNVTYDPVAKKASGYFIENHIYSGLIDSNTGNDIPICP